MSTIFLFASVRKQAISIERHLQSGCVILYRIVPGTNVPGTICCCFSDVCAEATFYLLVIDLAACGDADGYVQK